MRRGSLAAGALAGWLAGCGAAPSEPPAAPAPTPGLALTVATAEAQRPSDGPAETPDEAFRYQPPLVTAGGWTPPPVIEVQAGAVRVLLLERHELPYAVARVTAHTDDRGHRPWLDEVVLTLALDGPSAGGGPPLRAELAALGAQVWPVNGWDEIGVEITASAPVMGEALATTLRAFAGTEPRAWKGFDALRTELMEHVKQRPPRTESARGRLLKALMDLLPAGHRYREPASTPADLEKIGLPDASRRRAALLSVERARIAVAGDLTPEALRAALPPALVGHDRGAPRAARPPPITRGALLVEEEGAKRVELAVVLPADPLGAPGSASAPYLDWALSKVVFEWMKSSMTTPWSNGKVDRIVRRDLALRYVAVSVEPADVARVARGILDALGRVARGEGVDDILDPARRSVQRFLDTPYVSNVEAVRSIAFSNTMDLPADQRARDHGAFLRTGRAQVLASAAALFKREEARIVAVGAVAAAEAEIKQLGLGPVKLVRPDPAGAKGAQKK